MNHSTVLSPDPDWHQAATELIAGLAALDSSEARVELLEQLCGALGDRLYPAFLHILYRIARYADTSARQLIAVTLIDCLLSGRLPSGRLSAWGSSILSGDSAFGQTRILGPVEYVCAWYAQPSGQPPLARDRFADITAELLELIGSDERMRQLYAAKLLGDADDPLSGSLARQTRLALHAMATHWQHNSDGRALVDVFTDTLQGESLLAQMTRRPYGGDR